MSLKLRPATVACIALNSSGVSEEEARAAIASAEEETGLPADDPVRFGAGKLLVAVLNAAPLSADKWGMWRITAVLACASTALALAGAASSTTFGVADDAGQ